MEVVHPDGYYTGRWSVFEETCEGCGKALVSVCPEPDEPILKLCTTCITQRMDQHKEAEFEEKNNG